ncbi:MAG: DegV family EDD domain-containing protein [Pseudobutyrivibrio sp.]|nr:DegV family EDD domain-containing protein [Pseudobutyrivibrio sp.]
MNRFQRLIDKVTSPDLSFDRRTLILVGFFSEIAIIISLLGDVIIGENIVEILVLIGLVTINPVFIFIGTHFDKVEFSAQLQVFTLVFIALPVTFIYGGGPYGGGVCWIAFAYMFIGVGLTGAYRIFMLLSVTAITIAEYIAWYFHPEWIVDHSRKMFMVDSLISLLLVGILISITLFFEKYIFRRENDRAKKAAQQAEDLNESQSLFFSTMSHEIRTPINSILGLNEIILRQKDASDEIRRDAMNIQGAGKMLLTLVNDILDISKIEAGKMSIVNVNYSIGSLISEIVNMVWLRAEEKGLKLKVDIDPAMPTELYGDEVRIKQILINLLNNSVKYTEKGSITLYMECEEIKGDKALINLTVSDTGIGIKNDAIPHLFDSFQRVDQERNRYIEGTGLGLSIVKQLVDLMGGKITVNSVYSQGTTFSVHLWQTVTDESQLGEISVANIVKYSSEKYQSGFTAEEARILIVDDNEMNLEVEKKLLEDTEIVIDTVLSGKAALEKTLDHRYDVIFMDHLMPNMDGIEAFSKIRNQVGGLNNETPVVVLTANAGSDNIKLYNTNGFDGYLMKPVSGKELESMLLKHLPESKVTLNGDHELVHENSDIDSGYSKKVPIIITTSSMCDLPQSVIKELTIEMIPFIISNGAGSFYDNIEVECDELVYYMGKNSEDLDTQPPSVEDFEEFFARVLKKCHHVIYIALTTGISQEYQRAVEASAAFENITVINSESISSSMGFMVMAANQMAQQGESVERIVARIESLKKKIHCSFIIDSTEYMVKKNLISEGVYRLMKTMHMRPSLSIKKDALRMDRIWFGSTKKCYERYINHAFPVGVNPDKDVLFITHVDLSDETLDWITNQVKKKYDFQNIICQKASAAISLSCGPGAFGLLYMDKGHHKYNFSVQLAKGRDVYEDDYDEVDDTEEIEEFQEFSVEDFNEIPRNYDPVNKEPVNKEPVNEETPNSPEPVKSSEGTIKGIDMDVALKNSGSKDAFVTVLKIFYDTIDKKATDIQNYYESQDWKNFTILVHGLKSAARLIGAVDLGNAAEKMEMAGKAEDLAYIKDNYKTLMTDYLKYKEYLAAELEEKAASEEKPEADMELMTATYEALKLGAENMDCSMIEDTFAEIDAYKVPDSEMATYKALKESFDNFDYDGMADILNRR